MSIELEIGKYNENKDLGGFQKMQFSSIDEAIATIEFLKLGYNSFKNGESLLVRLGKGAKPHLLDYDSLIPLNEIRQELKEKYNQITTEENEIEFKITTKPKKESLNSNFSFSEDSETLYAKTSTGESLPFKLFRSDDSGIGSNLLRESQNSGENTDFALIERRFFENNTLQFFGAEKIENHNDIAWLFRSLEDEAVEHAFLVYDFEDKGYFVQHISTGSFNAALIDNKQIIGNIIEANPSSITLVHNHPSGNLNASEADAYVLEKLKIALKNTDVKVNDGIIINLKSGKYLVFNEKLLHELKQKTDNPQPLFAIQAYSFSKQVLVENFQPINVKSPEEVAAYITSQKFGVSDKNEMLILNSQLHIIGKFILPANNQENFIIEKVSKFGGSNCVLYGNNITPELVNFYSKRLEHSNITITDAILLKSENGQKMWESFMNEGKMVANYNANTNTLSENYNSNYNQMEKNELSWSDRVITPKTKAYKDFINEMENTPSEKWFQDGERKFTENEKKSVNHNEIIGGKIKDIALESIKNPDYLKQFDINTQNVVKEYLDKSFNLQKDISNTLKRSDSIKNERDEDLEWFQNLPKHIPKPIKENKEFKYSFESFSQEELVELKSKKLREISFEQMADNFSTIQNLRKEIEKIDKILENNINSKNPTIMETQKEFDQVEYLKKQLKYLGFGESEKLHKDLEAGINSPEKSFEIKTTSDKTLPENKVDFNIKFNKSEKGGVFLNSYDATLSNDKNESISQNFKVSKENTFTAKEAVNLLEGRSVKIAFDNPKTEQRETAFVKLNLAEEKNQYGNFNFQTFHQNYGVDTNQIVEKSNLIFDKPEYKENTIKSLEKGNIVKVKFELDDKTIEGKAVLNPQYKNLNLYDSDMNRLNTNKPLQGIDNDNKHEKSNVREQSISRGI